MLLLQQSLNYPQSGVVVVSDLHSVSRVESRRVLKGLWWHNATEQVVEVYNG